MEGLKAINGLEDTLVKNYSSKTARMVEPKAPIGLVIFLNFSQFTS